MSLNIALACGGTGGHIMPGLATAEVLMKRGHHVVLWLTGRDTETKSIQGWSGEIVRVPAEGFPNGISIKALRTAWKIWRAGSKCRRIMRRKKPDIVLAMGSFASAGPVLAAWRLGIPYVMHEANVIPGRAVSLFARRARVVACSFEETRFYLPGRNVEVTGMPLRASLESPLPSEPLMDRNLFTLLVMGGSSGAHLLNERVAEALIRFAPEEAKVQIIHLTGIADEAGVREQYRAAGIKARVHAFHQDMASLYRITDLAICRAGASTCAELFAFSVPSLLVPYPHAARDHQTLNARAMEKIGAADVVQEKDLSVEWLHDYIRESILHPGRLARMSASLKARAPDKAADRLADLLESSVGGVPHDG